MSLSHYHLLCSSSGLLSTVSEASCCPPSLPVVSQTLCRPALLPALHSLQTCWPSWLLLLTRRSLLILILHRGEGDRGFGWSHQVSIFPAWASSDQNRTGWRLRLPLLVPQHVPLRRLLREQYIHHCYHCRKLPMAASITGPFRYQEDQSESRFWSLRDFLEKFTYQTMIFFTSDVRESPLETFRGGTQANGNICNQYPVTGLVFLELTL